MIFRDVTVHTPCKRGRRGRYKRRTSAVFGVSRPESVLALIAAFNYSDQLFH